MSIRTHVIHNRPSPLGRDMTESEVVAELLQGYGLSYTPAQVASMYVAQLESELHAQGEHEAAESLLLLWEPEPR